LLRRRAQPGDFGPAIAHFEKAVKLVPQSELYSLGLFHVLRGQGMREEALDEAKRFMTISDSDEYREIVAAINSHWPRGV
jgi:hypothetical protein